MNQELRKTLQATEKIQEYDTSIKFILSQKIILAHILAGTVKELKGKTPEEILPYIEGDVQVDSAFVEPGLSNGKVRIQGSNTQDTIPGEGSVTYDVKFYVRYPQAKGKQRIKLLIDIEAQKDFYPSYDLVTRGIYYAARQISSQKEVEFTKSEYNDIKKVYSIWICLYPPKYCENTIVRYFMKEQVIHGNRYKGKFRYDLMEVIMIHLPRQIPREEEPTLNGMLKTLFSPELSSETIMKRLEDIYHIPKDEELEGGIKDMCNFGEAILERGIEQGIQRGIEQGMTKGEEVGKLKTLSALVREGLLSLSDAAKHMGISEEAFAEQMNK